MSAESSSTRTGRNECPRSPLSGAAFLAFQNAHDRRDRVPVPRRRPAAEQLVELTKIADRFHVTAVLAEDKSVPRRENSYEPLAVRRQGERNGGRRATSL